MPRLRPANPRLLLPWFGWMLIAPATACDRPRAVEPPPPPRDGALEAGLAWGEVRVQPLGAEPVRVRVEFAVAPEDRNRGLMFRDQLDEDAGMLFVFPPPDRHQTFWMRNTLIPLDMIFIDGARRVVGVVERAEPLTETPRSVPGDSRYVLEVNGGFARRHGIGPGARVEIVGLTESAGSPDR